MVFRFFLSNLNVEGKGVEYDNLELFDTILNYADRQALLPRQDSNLGP